MSSTRTLRTGRVYDPSITPIVRRRRRALSVDSASKRIRLIELAPVNLVSSPLTPTDVVLPMATVLGTTDDAVDGHGPPHLDAQPLESSTRVLDAHSLDTTDGGGDSPEQTGARDGAIEPIAGAADVDLGSIDALVAMATDEEDTSYHTGGYSPPRRTTARVTPQAPRRLSTETRFFHSWLAQDDVNDVEDTINDPPSVHSDSDDGYNTPSPYPQSVSRATTAVPERHAHHQRRYASSPPSDPNIRKALESLEGTSAKRHRKEVNLSEYALQRWLPFPNLGIEGTRLL